MPKLKTVLKSLDELEESLKGLYQENGHGEFVLQLEDVDSHPTVRGLRTALDAAKAQREKFRDQVAAFQPLMDAVGEDGDLGETVHDLVARLGDKGEGDKDAEARVAARVQATEQKFQRMLEKAQGRAGSLEKALHSTLVDRELDAALDKLKVPAELRPGARALMKEKGPKVLELGEGEYRGVFPVDIHGVPEANQPIGDYLTAWAESEEAAAYLPANTGGGSGAPANRGGGGGGKAKVFTAQQLHTGQFDIEALAKGEASVQG